MSDDIVARLRVLNHHAKKLAENGNNSVIYVPTEAGLPILEAGKR